MANTFSKVLVNTAYLAAKLLRNYKKAAVKKKKKKNIHPVTALA